MASWLAALMRAANNNRRTCLIGALALWHLVRWRRARELEDEERVARAEARIRDERRRRDDAQRERRRRRRRRAGAYTLQEAGATQGALGDEKTSGYGWFLTKPLQSFDEVSREKKAKRSVRFQLDAAQEFYGFAFRCRDAVCVAHGTQPEFVGLSLSECLRRTRNDSIDGQELHGRFCEAASVEGGSWVEYAWRRTASSPLKTKGAWISRVTAKNGDDLYVGVGFAVLPPIQAPTDGLYGFVVNGDGKIVAHGGSRALVGKTLEDAVRLSDNSEVDGAELTRRIVGAGERGGGWLAYPWRNQASDTLKGKGCYVVKLQRDATEATDSGGELSGSELSGGELSDEGILRRKVGRRAVGADTVLYAGVGYFERDARHTPPSIPPSPEAARAALDALVEVVGGGADPATAVSDDRLGAAAAASTCWSRTALPRELADVLRERAVAHIRDATISF